MQAVSGSRSPVDSRKSFHPWIWLHSGAGGTAGLHISTFMSIQGQRKLAYIVQKALKSIQVLGSPRGHGSVLLISCCSICKRSEVTDNSWAKCVMGLLAEVTEAPSWTPAGDGWFGWQMAAVPSPCSLWCKLPLCHCKNIRHAGRLAHRHWSRTSKMPTLRQVSLQQTFLCT